MTPVNISGIFNKGRITGDTYGYIDKTGSIIIKPQFKDARLFKEGLATVKAKSGKYGFINIKGELVIETLFNWIYDFNEGISVVEYDEV